MNEVINGFEAVKTMNSVEGFDPAKFARQISEQDDNGGTTNRSYLDVVYRKLWFRLKHPEGAIRKFVREINDKFGDKYLETAETAAVGRALADAGFGIQFADVGDVPDASVVDAPVGMPSVNLPLGTTVNTITGEVMQSSQSSKSNFTPDMPVEAIMPQMTLNYAVNVVIDCGFYKGKTLGQVAQEKPSSLEWYVNTYKGNNNILRAAAKFLLDSAAA